MAERGYMGARDSIIETFRKAVLGGAYRSVTVSSICRDAGISRNTFYRYFHDRREIIAAIFDENVIEPMRSLNVLLPVKTAFKNTTFIQEGYYEAIKEDGDFYLGLVSPVHSENYEFVSALCKVLIKWNCEVLKKVGFSGAEWERDYIARYFSVSQAAVTEQWLVDGMDVPVADLARLFARLANPYWDNEFNNTHNY